MNTCSCKSRKVEPRAGPQSRRHGLGKKPLSGSFTALFKQFPKLKITGKLQEGTGQWNPLGVAGESLPAQQAPPSPVLPKSSLWQGWGFLEGSQPLSSQDLGLSGLHLDTVLGSPGGSPEQTPALTLGHLSPFPQRLALHPTCHPVTWNRPG